MEFLTESAAHEQIARIGDEGHERHFEVGPADGDDREADVFPGGRIDEQAEQKALPCGQSGVPCGDPEGEGYGKISQCDGNTVPQTLREHLASTQKARKWAKHSLVQYG